jgi:hypothetical protein
MKPRLQVFQYRRLLQLLTVPPENPVRAARSQLGFATLTLAHIERVAAPGRLVCPAPRVAGLVEIAGSDFL